MFLFILGRDIEWHVDWIYENRLNNYEMISIYKQIENYPDEQLNMRNFAIKILLSAFNEV